MTDVEIRTLADDELRTAQTLFMRSLHRPPVTDEQWELVGRSFEPGRTWGAFAGDVLAGTALSWASKLRVPGGQVRGLAAVTRVGVRADHRRRGVLTGLMRAQLAEVAARGEVFAGLRATEPVIYGRFGYGVATRFHTVTVARDRAVFHPGLPATGEVRLLDTDRALEVLPDLYERIVRARVGSMARPDALWRTSFGWPIGTGHDPRIAVHTGPDGDEGYAVFAARRPDAGNATLEVDDLQGSSPAAVAALWRFLLSIDLVDEVKVLSRPVDEPVEAMFVDQRAVSKVVPMNDLWLRVVDVPEALAARSWGGPLTLEVRDALLPGNTGVYRVSESGVDRVDAEPELSVDVDVLAQLYFGRWTVSALAGVNRLRVANPEAAARADAAFALPATAWTGTFF
ncbi:GNAT family N-acetyltransferase [Actinokineospora spheciospongiae]|uniref:GNAT family N-acetyltransferase n=1 Tax=Actinokineospora spheciospongiae TaxID=909613 RepID=UPI0005593203|nr:GNAT family N-acetyltransferase [Actinokineospora spheciospongiae]